MQADNIPITEEPERQVALDQVQRLRLGSGASLFKFLKTNILKSKPPTEIHSSSLSTVEGKSTLAPFYLAGVNVKRVNRDYEAFKGSAWVDSSETTGDSRDAQRNAAALVPPAVSSLHSEGDWNEQAGRMEDKEKGGRDRQSKFGVHQPSIKQPWSKTSAEGMREGSREEKSKPSGSHSPQNQRKAGMLPPLPPAKKVPFLPPLPAAGGGGAAGFHRQGTEVRTYGLLCAVDIRTIHYHVYSWCI